MSNISPHGPENPLVAVGITAEIQAGMFTRNEEETDLNGPKVIVTSATL